MQSDQRTIMRPSFWMLGALVVLVAMTVWLLDVLADRARGDRAGVAGQERLAVIGEVPGFSLTGSDGKAVTRDDLLGKLWIVDFVFTQCSGTCPQMSRGMARLQEALRDLPDLRLVSVTCDPDNDTAERLQAYGRGFGADPQRWLFLRGSLLAVQQLATNALKLGVRPATAEDLAQGSERILHSTRFVLVDRHGRVRGYYDGIDDEAVGRLVDDARALASQR
jgi:protein SCO1/2